MIRRILAALSGTPYTHSVITHAVAIAQRHGAEITGVTVLDPKKIEDVGPVPMGAGSFATELARHRWRLTEERVEEVVADFERTCRDAGVGCQVVREQGDPFDELVSLWRYHDFTVLELRGFFEYGVLSSPDDSLKELVKVGVRPLFAVSQEPRKINRALIAYNGSMESAKAMKRFIQAQVWPSVALKIVCFDMKDEAARLLADAAAYCRAHGFEAEVENLDATPAEGLLAEIESWRADLVVLGATRRRRIFQQALGDTALEMIRNCPVPLFLMQ
ncbi:MAG: universal stress protein [Thermoanaerobaculia bacterium]|nr:universal stress protein [Thermoanaerobaculia bacterium]